LSTPNRISDKYILELNYLNIRKQQNFHKYLVSKFSRSLFVYGLKILSLSSLIYLVYFKKVVFRLI